jgi:hypothetical protein
MNKTADQEADHIDRRTLMFPLIVDQEYRAIVTGRQTLMVAFIEKLGQ